MNAESPVNVIELKFPENIKLTEFIQKLLRSRRKAEALQWLKNSHSGARRAIGRFKGAAPSIHWVNDLYAAGAAKVFATDITAKSDANQHSDKIVVELPADQKLRAGVFKWCKRQGDKIGYLPDTDGGESHLYLYIG